MSAMDSDLKNKQRRSCGSDASACSTVVFRVQDRDGRGPWKPGFSQCWVEDRDDHDNLLPWYSEMGPVHKLGIVGMHQGTSCESLEQLRRWFTKSEYRTLRRYGYQAVQMDVGRILGKSETQLVFERAKPNNVGCRPVVLYPSNAKVLAPADEKTPTKKTDV
jgi:hypothetical protein